MPHLTRSDVLNGKRTSNNTRRFAFVKVIREIFFAPQNKKYFGATESMKPAFPLVKT